MAFNLNSLINYQFSVVIMSFRIQINDQPVKYCVACDVFHPFTKEFWQIRNADKQYGVCKAVKKEYGQSERGKSTRKKYKQSDKGKAAVQKYKQSDNVKIVSKKEKQRNWDRRMINSSKSTDKKIERYEEGGYLTREYLKNCMRVQQEKCFHCGGPMVFGEGINRSTNGGAATVERMNNDLGHFCCNCVLIHNRCQWVNHPLNH